MGRSAAQVAVAAIKTPHSTRTAPSDTSSKAPQMIGDSIPANRAIILAIPVADVRMDVGNTSGVYVVKPATKDKH